MSFIRFQQAAATAQVDPSSPVIPASDAAAWLDAEQFLREARLEAERITGTARQALEVEKQRGYQEGLELARFEQTEQMIDTASRTVDLFASIEQKMVGLVMDSVRRLVADYSDTDRVMAVVRSALAVLRNQRQLTLRVAPEFADHVRSQATELLQQFPGVGILDIVADPRLKDDSTILESEIGVVEASMASQLKAIENGFTKVLGTRI